MWWNGYMSHMVRLWLAQISHYHVLTFTFIIIYVSWSNTSLRGWIEELWGRYSNIHTQWDTNIRSHFPNTCACRTIMHTHLAYYNEYCLGTIESIHSFIKCAVKHDKHSVWADESFSGQTIALCYVTPLALLQINLSIHLTTLFMENIQNYITKDDFQQFCAQNSSQPINKNTFKCYKHIYYNLYHFPLHKIIVRKFTSQTSIRSRYNDMPFTNVLTVILFIYSEIYKLQLMLSPHVVLCHALR